MTRVFTTGVVLHGGKLLIMKRRDDDETYPGRWDCVGGHFERGESAEACMLREALEETGQKMKIVRPGPLIEFLDEYGRAVAVPFLLRPDRRKMVVTSEHSQHRWVKLSDVGDYEVVPDLAIALSLFGLGGRRERRGARTARTLPRRAGSRPRS